MSRLSTIKNSSNSALAQKLANKAAEEQAQRSTRNDTMHNADMGAAQRNWVKANQADVTDRDVLVY